jgi:16S rRNA (uracil1498-N3)-methyltransferase
MQRYFIHQNQIESDLIHITEGDSHHIQKVMRMQIKDQILVCDQKNTYRCEIVAMLPEEVLVKIVDIDSTSKELPVEVTIAQGIVMREKMETVIDNVTELGASYYLPVEMEYCTARFSQEKKDQKMIRMNKIAKEASEQCHRTHLLSVLEPVSFSSLLSMSKNYDLCLVAYERSTKDDSIKKLLEKKNYSKVLVLIGPEGGISEKEMMLLDSANFHRVTLGPRILRTQVAPVYVMSAISYVWEENDDNI